MRAQATSRDRQGAVFSVPNHSLTVAARCVCAHDKPSTINGGAARLALQRRDIVSEILASQSKTQKKFFGTTIFHSEGVARLERQMRSARATHLRERDEERRFGGVTRAVGLADAVGDFRDDSAPRITAAAMPRGLDDGFRDGVFSLAMCAPQLDGFRMINR